MAAPPVKSQPLHNFSLPHLKWTHKSSPSSASASAPSSHHHRFGRRDSPDQRRRRSPDPENPSHRSPPDSPRNFGEGDENGEGKPWNLRPRREITRAAATPKQEPGKNDKANVICRVIKSERLRGMVEGGQLKGGAERKGKRRVWVSLSREEIEEDIFVLTGGKPSRKHRKWPKNVQKQLDNVFPGSHLVGVAVDSYQAMIEWYVLGSCFSFLM